MIIFYIDESGIDLKKEDWKDNNPAQPFYVLSALCINHRVIKQSFTNLRNSITLTNLPQSILSSNNLGYGEEIKGSNLFKKKFWGKHNNKVVKKDVRNHFLSFPKNNNAVIISTVFKKNGFDRAYNNNPDKFEYDNPYKQSFQYLLERIQKYLEDIDDFGICIIDGNPYPQEKDLQDQSSVLTQTGSDIRFLDYLGNKIMLKLQFNRIVDCAFKKSEHSIGLMVADFYATHIYQYFKSDRKELCKWWMIIEQSLRSKHGKYLGYGLKIFPETLESNIHTLNTDDIPF